MPVLRESAPFKLNLSLRVVGRRADGYHLLETLFAFVESGDVLEWTPDGPLQLKISGPFAHAAPADASNLVLRAAHLLDPAGRHGGTLHLIKNVPSGAGLGGGSADAAAALRLLNTAWHCGHDLEALAALATQLGADVPVCVYGRPAWARGIGDALSFLDVRADYPVLVLCPDVHLATAAVFAARRDAFAPAAALWPPADSRRDGKCWHNDLSVPAQTIAPELAQIMAAAQRCSAADEDVIGYGMSG